MKFRCAVLVVCSLFSTFATETKAQSPAGSLPEGVVNVVYPTYPPLARAARATGVVSVRVSVDSTGKTVETKFMEGHPLFRQAVLDAVKKWTFKPVSPRKPYFELNFEFRLAPCGRETEDIGRFDASANQFLIQGCEIPPEVSLEELQVLDKSSKPAMIPDCTLIICGPNFGFLPGGLVQGQPFSINGLRERKQ